MNAVVAQQFAAENDAEAEQHNQQVWKKIQTFFDYIAYLNVTRQIILKREYGEAVIVISE